MIEENSNIFVFLKIIWPSHSFSRAEEGCPNCGGVVFEAEKVGENGKYYHKRCFICCKCRRPQDDKLQVNSSFVFLVF